MYIFKLILFYIPLSSSVDSHSIDTDDFKEGLIYVKETNSTDNNEYIKHFLLLVMQTVAMFVVSIFFF